jgi:hypothetical protein
MVLFLPRLLTPLEQKLLQINTLDLFHIQKLVTSMNMYVIHGRFSHDNNRIVPKFVATHVIDANSKLYPIPTSMLYNYDCHTDHKLQYDILRLPYTVKVGDILVIPEDIFLK